MNINHLEYSDFTGDGIDEAVGVASPCASGTAGPDVHTVLSRRSDVEAASCYSSAVAYIDIQVDGMYKPWLDSLNRAESDVLRIEQDVLRIEQKDWLRKAEPDMQK